MNSVWLTREEAKEWFLENLENVKVISMRFPRKKVVEIEYVVIGE